MRSGEGGRGDEMRGKRDTFLARVVQDTPHKQREREEREREERGIKILFNEVMRVGW
jgi:hypothetical protein